MGEGLCGQCMAELWAPQQVQSCRGIWDHRARACQDSRSSAVSPTSCGSQELLCGGLSPGPAVLEISGL